MGDKHWPIDPATPVSSPFGYRDGFAVPGSAAWLAGLHDGTDFAADYGTPVYAAHAGYLRNLTDPGGYGQYVQIDGNGLMSQYGHVRDMWLVPDGTWVEPGTWIAGVGSEGMSTGPHLHFRLHVMGTATDPIPWLADAAWQPGGTAVAPSAPLADTVQAQVYRWGVANGLTDAGIAGLLGNMAQESGFDPGIIETPAGYEVSHSLDDIIPGIREGIGLCQWSYSRREGLVAFAAERGTSWQDVDLQLAWILAECAADEGYAEGLYALRTATDPVAAAYAWEAAYEGAAIVGPRGDFAAEQYALITSGAYGTRGAAPVTPAAPAAPATPPYLPIHQDAYLGDDMATTLIIDIKGAPADLPATWEYTGGVLQPFLDASLAGDYQRQTRSYGMFLPLFARYLTVSRLGLDGVPVERQLRDAAAAALSKFNGGT